jgi:hypothetical protein
MAGLNNLKGKKAAPFVSGGGRSKTHPRDARGRAHRALKNAKARKAADLANASTGTEIDLDWSDWNKAHKGQPRKAGVSKQVVKGFKKSAGLKGSAFGSKAVAVAQKRVAKPGDHFRAKALLAAQNGDVASAKKFLAKRAAKMARHNAKPPAARPVQRAATSVPAVHTRPPRKSKSMKGAYRIQRQGAANKRAALRQLSTLDAEDIMLARAIGISPIDLAGPFRYKHGWIKILADTVNTDPVGHEGLGERVGKANNEVRRPGDPWHIVEPKSGKTKKVKYDPKAGLKAQIAQVHKDGAEWTKGNEQGYADAAAGKSPDPVGSESTMFGAGYSRGYARYYDEASTGVTGEELSYAAKIAAQRREMAKQIARAKAKDASPEDAKMILAAFNRAYPEVPQESRPGPKPTPKVTKKKGRARDLLDRLKAGQPVIPTWL